MAKQILDDPLFQERPISNTHRAISPHWSSKRAGGTSSSADLYSNDTDFDLSLLQKKLMEIDLSSIKEDAQTDVNIRKKLGIDAVSLDKHEKSALVPDVENKVGAEFTRSPLEKKIRMVFNDVLRRHHLISVASAPPHSKWEWKIYPSEIFSASCCMEVISAILAMLADALDSMIPFSNVCHTVLHMPHGLWILDRMLLHNRGQILTVYGFLMDQCSGDDIDDSASVFYSRVLLHLAQIFTDSAMQLRHLAIGRQGFFILILSLTLQKVGAAADVTARNLYYGENGMLEDPVVDVLHQLLETPKAENREWGVDSSRRAASDNNSQFEQCRVQLLHYANGILPHFTKSLPEHLISAATRVVQIYVHLKESAGLTLSQKEYRIFGQLLTCRTPLTASGNAYIVLGLCCFTAFPDLLLDRVAETEFVDWVKMQLDVDVGLLDEMVPMGGTHLEVLLLLASHLRSGQYKEISEILNEYLHVKALLRNSLRVPPTQNLNANFESTLPVHCIYNILQNKTYAAYNVSVKEWIFSQLRKCSLPIHPVMVQVLATYIQTTLPILRKTSDGPEDYISLQKPFTPAEICSIIFDVPEMSKTEMRKLRTVDLFLRPDASDPYRNAPKVLMAYYVLAYNDFYMSNLKIFLIAKLLHTQPYGTDLLEKIPFKHYLALTVKYQELYEPLGDTLGRLMLQRLPHMRTVFDEIKSGQWDDGLVTNIPGQSEGKKRNFIPAIVPVSGSLARYLDLLTRYPQDRIGSCMDDFLTILPRVLTEDLPDSSQDAFEKVWSQLADVDPNTLLLATTQAFLWTKDPTVPLMTFEELCFEPLHVLRCASVVFQKAFLTRILLRIFSSYLSASKVYLTQQLEIIDQQQLFVSSGETADSTREERKRSMFMLQESVAAQILIEQCADGHGFRSSKTTEMDQFQLPEKLTDSQNAICTFIHQMIINNPTLAKLIIFQGFPPWTIPHIVRGVESLHICFDYLHEAMALPSIEKKLFVLDLTCALCAKFRISRTLAVGKLAVDVIATILIAYPGAIRREVIKVGARCLARLGNIFPPLREECIGVLEQMLDTEEASRIANRSWSKNAKRVLSNGENERSLSGLLKAAVECAGGKYSLRS